MKNISKNFIVASNKLEWKKILLIYSTYDPLVPNYDWVGPVQFFRIDNVKGTDWNPYETLEELYKSPYLVGYSQIPIEDFLNNY